MSTEDKVIENMGVVSDKLVQYMDAAEKVITQYGGDAVNLGLNVLRIEAAGNLVVGIAWVLLIWPLFKSVQAGLRTSDGEWRNKSTLVELLHEIDAEVPAVLLGTIGMGVAIYQSLTSLFYIWNWVGIFWPEAYAVHKFLM